MARSMASGTMAEGMTCRADTPMPNRGTNTHTMLRTKSVGSARQQSVTQNSARCV